MQPDPATHVPGDRAPASTLHAVVECQAALLSQPALAPAAAAFVSHVGARLHYDRIAVGIVEGTCVETIARSDRFGPESNSALVARLNAAMAEALDQRATLVVPETRRHAHPRITLAHRALLESRAGAASTVPLMAGDRLVGALCAERWGDRTITAADVETLEQLASQAGPVLALMYRNELGTFQRLRQTAKERLYAWRHGEGSPRRVAAVAAALLLALLLVIPTDVKVGGHARLEGAIQRVMVAPADGFLRDVHARPGDTVKAGQVLVELAEQDLRLERQRWDSQMAQYETAYAAANARSDRAQLVINHSRAAEAEAQLALIDMKLARARIEAPFDGVVIRGDLSQALGAPVKLGEDLMAIAPSNRFRVVVEIEERDIAYVSIGQRGSLALSALPWNTLPLEVTRITPMATAAEGRNVFEVEATLLKQPSDLRPGLHGSARIVIGRGTTLWNWSHRLVESVRLAWWGFVG